MRDRCRAREAAIGELKAAPLRRNAFWLQHARRSTGRATWGPAPRRWLSEVVCPTPAQQIVFQDYARAVNEHPARGARLAQERKDQVQTWRLAPVVEVLQALRGVQCTVAVTMVAARGDRTRFVGFSQSLYCLVFLERTPTAEDAVDHPYSQPRGNRQRKWRQDYCDRKH
jgi:hypothetical protein